MIERDPDINRLMMNSLQERIQDREGEYDFLDFPRRGEERYQALKEWAIAQCEVDESLTDSVALKKVWLNEPTSQGGERTYPISAYVKAEEQKRERSWYDRYDFISERRHSREVRKPYFCTYKEFESPLLPGDLERLQKELDQRLRADLSPGSISRNSETVEISLGKRRPQHISHSDICLALFIHDRLPSEEVWSAAKTRPELYRSVVAPHFQDVAIGSESPFDWAKDRVSIVNGFAQTLIGRDYPLQAAEYSYKQVAQVVGNLRPTENEEIFKFDLSPKGQLLLAALGSECLPEAAYLALKLEQHIEVADIQSVHFSQFLSHLPEYLNRGLNIGRVVELVLDLAQSGGGENQFLDYAVKLTSKVFATDRAPWWFQENQSFIPNPKPDNWGSSVCLQAHIALAQATGAHYQYAKNVWELNGKKVAELVGIDQSLAISLTKTITENYGIGNEQRADNVFQFAIQAIAEAQPEQRQSTVVSLCDMLKRHRPHTEIIGALEGSDANFSKPGMLALHLNLTGKREADQPDLLSINFNPTQLKETINAASASLEERAKIRPTNRLDYTPRARFITDVSEAGVLKLPVPEQYKLSGPTQSPLLTWVDYESQLHREVPAHCHDSVSELYLNFFAHKMPSPFAPPPGFLAFLNAFRNLRDSEWRPSFMFHPNEREQVEINQAKDYMDRLSVLCSWLDTAVLGLQTYEEVLDTFRWIILEQDNPTLSAGILSSEKKQLQVDAAWDAIELYRSNYEYSKESAQLAHERELRNDLGELGSRELELIALISGTQEKIEKHMSEVEFFPARLEECRLERESLEDDVRLIEDANITKRIDEIKAEEIELRWQLEISQNYQPGHSLNPLLRELEKVRAQMGKMRERLSDIASDFARTIAGENEDPGEEIERRSSFRDSYWGLSLYDDVDLGFEDPYSTEEAQFEPEDETKSHEDYFLERLESNQAEVNKKNERFQQLTYSVQYLSCLSALAAGEVCNALDLRTIVSQLGTSMREGSLAFTESPALVFDNFKQVSEAFKAMNEHGILDHDKLNSALHQFDSPQALVGVIQNVTNLVAPFESAKALIESELHASGNFHSQLTYVAFINDSLCSKLKALFEEASPFFAADAAQRMLNEFFWLERYQLLMPHVRAFDAAEFPDSGQHYSETEVRPTLRTGMRICGTVFMFGEASKVFREQGNDPFLHLATPENISNLAVSQRRVKLITSSVPEDLSTAQQAESFLPAPYQNVPLISKADNSEKFIPFHVSQDLHLKMRLFREQVVECRRKDFGLLANGGKVHVIHEIDAYRLEFLKGHFGFTGTQFMLDNANQLITLPPTASSEEICLIANFLNAEGIIDWEFPEIQMCIAGRLNVGHCAILGSSVMWLSNVNVPYNENSFKTNRDDETAFRMMIYDSNGARNEFPFNVSRDLGRTDMLGRRSLSDFILYQRIASVLSYAEEPLDGSNHTIQLKHLEVFHDLAHRYKREYKKVLEAHGLSSILKELWLNPVYLSSKASTNGRIERFQALQAGGERHFRRAIKPVMDAWNECEELSEKAGKSVGIRADVEKVYDRLENGIRDLQEDMLKDPAYDRHRNELFNLDP